MIDDTKIKFENNNSISEKKEKLHKELEKIDTLYLDKSKERNKLVDNFHKTNYVANKGIIFEGWLRNDNKKSLYKEKTRLDKLIKKIIDLENEFINYKRQKRIEKLIILESIDLLMKQLETLDKKRFRALLKKINNIEYRTKEKVYHLKHILGHLRAGKISDSVNIKSIFKYRTIPQLLKKEQNMVEGIKEMRKKIREEQKKEKEERIEKAKAAKAEKIKKLSEEIENIKQHIIKIYQRKLVGMNVPEDIKKSINKLKKQTLSDQDKKLFDKKVKRYNLILSKLKALKKSS
jgi:hypothetical protein